MWRNVCLWVSLPTGVAHRTGTSGRQADDLGLAEFFHSLALIATTVLLALRPCALCHCKGSRCQLGKSCVPFRVEPRLLLPARWPPGAVPEVRGAPSPPRTALPVGAGRVRTVAPRALRPPWRYALPHGRRRAAGVRSAPAPSLPPPPNRRGPARARAQWHHPRPISRRRAPLGPAGSARAAAVGAGGGGWGGRRAGGCQPCGAVPGRLWVAARLSRQRCAGRHGCHRSAILPRSARRGSAVWGWGLWGGGATTFPVRSGGGGDAAG